MSNTRNIKTDEIESNSTNNLKFKGTGEIQFETGAFPNIAQDEVIIRNSSDNLISSGVPISSVTKNVVDTTDPTNEGSNSGYSVGSRWFNSTNDKLFILVSDTSTPSDFADFIGQATGMTTDVTIVADNDGVAGNSIVLSFDGIDDISTVLNAWNIANPGNTATATSGDFGQVPDNLESITLSGGVDAVDGGVWESVSGFSLIQDTLANIIAMSRVAGAIYLATDTGDYLGDDGTTLTSLNVLKDTFANLNALTRFAGRIVYATDQSVSYLDNGTSLVPMGSGGGGVDVWLNEDFEVTSASDFTTGNGVSLSGGTLNGALTDETVSPIQGLRSISYVQAASSLNDFFFLPTQTIGVRQQGKDNQFIVFATYDGDNDDIEYIAYNDTNSFVLASGFVKSSTVAQRINILGSVAASSTSIKIGFRTVVENIGAELIFDLVEANTSQLPIVQVGGDNVYSAYCDGSAAVSVSVVTENSSGTFTVSQIATGRFQINYSSLGLTVPPVVVASNVSNIGVDGQRIINVTTTTADIEMLNSAGGYTNFDFRVLIQKQGIDYNPPVNAFIQNSMQSWSDTGVTATSLIDAITTAPTFGTLTRNRVLKRTISDRTKYRYEIEMTTAGTAGSGNYLYSLPNGDRFGSEVEKFSGTLSNAIDTDFGKNAIDAGWVVRPGVVAYKASVVPYDDTSFRLVVTNFTSSEVHGSSFSSFANTHSMSIEFEAQTQQTSSQQLIIPAIRTQTLVLDTGNGYGSTNTKIRRYSNTKKSKGYGLFTYTDSATDGMSITINKAGVYTLVNNDYRLAGDAQEEWGISLNSSNLTTNISLIPGSERLVMTGVDSLNANQFSSCATIQLDLEVGDIIRAHGDGNASNDVKAMFSICGIVSM